MEHTYTSLLADLKALDIDAEGILVVHSSFKAVGPVEGGPETVLDALIEYMKDGLLVLPTHSWAEGYLKDNIYDPLTEPSCVGILTNLFLKRPGVLRSLHPTHSVGALGKGAEEFISGEEKSTTPCPPWGCWGKMYTEDAQILFLGAPLTSNTFIHGMEERRDIPDRLNPVIRNITVKVPDGSSYNVPLLGHHSSHGNVSLNYGKLLPLFLEKGIAREGKIGSADSVLTQARPMGDLVLKILDRDPDFFSDLRPWQ